VIGNLFSVLLGRGFCSDWRAIQHRIDAECAYFARFPGRAPPLLSQKLLVSGEDHRHGLHPGFDPIAIARALWRRLTRGSREGASTIEQQVVRVVTGRYERTLARKIREILLAVLVARKYSKDVLPAVYLSIGYYGWQMNGYLQACARLHLGPDLLTLDDASGLVARLKYPEPRKASLTRLIQIDRRAGHLRHLHQRHVLDGTYRYLDASSVFSFSTALEPVPQS
jgi:membrane peptidoglycan carboxypeptidase